MRSMNSIEYWIDVCMNNLQWIWHFAWAAVSLIPAQWWITPPIPSLVSYQPQYPHQRKAIFPQNIALLCLRYQLSDGLQPQYPCWYPINPNIQYFLPTHCFSCNMMNYSPPLSSLVSYTNPNFQYFLPKHCFKSQPIPTNSVMYNQLQPNKYFPKASTLCK